MKSTPDIVHPRVARREVGHAIGRCSGRRKGALRASLRRPRRSDGRGDGDGGIVGLRGLPCGPPRRRWWRLGRRGRPVRTMGSRRWHDRPSPRVGTLCGLERAARPDRGDGVRGKGKSRRSALHGRRARLALVLERSQQGEDRCLRAGACPRLPHARGLRDLRSNGRAAGWRGGPDGRFGCPARTADQVHSIRGVRARAGVHSGQGHPGDRDRSRSPAGGPRLRQCVRRRSVATRHEPAVAVAARREPRRPRRPLEGARDQCESMHGGERRSHARIERFVLRHRPPRSARPWTFPSARTRTGAASSGDRSSCTSAGVASFRRPSRASGHTR